MTSTIETRFNFGDTVYYMDGIVRQGRIHGIYVQIFGDNAKRKYNVSYRVSDNVMLDDALLHVSKSELERNE